MRLAIVQSQGVLISSKQGISNPRIRHKIQPMGAVGRKVKAVTSDKRNTGHRKDFIHGALGKAKASTPGRKFGMNRKIDSLPNPGMCGCRVPAMAHAIQSPSRDLNIGFRQIQINRNGSNTYICNSKGKDHNTFTIDFVYVRF
jgi:hypothetical protein